jgi:hypothetical protein
MVRTSSLLPARAKDEVRAATRRPSIRLSVPISSSVRPWLKYSSAGSRLRLAKGSTAMERRASAASAVEGPASPDRESASAAPPITRTASAVTTATRLPRDGGGTDAESASGAAGEVAGGTSFIAGVAAGVRRRVADSRLSCSVSWVISGSGSASNSSLSSAV